MSDQTVVKPRPGARDLPQKPSGPGTPEDGTQVGAPSRPADSGTRFRLPETQLDPVCDEASRLLSLADRLGQAESVRDVAALKRQCMALVTEYQQALRTREVSPDTVDTASYCICALLDELVLNSSWGQSSHWAGSSLLSEFHTQTWAGTHFFERVEQAQRSANISLLTLQYLCLSLGFKGRYRVEERGQEQLDILRDSLYRQICAEQGRFTTPFERSWQSRVVPSGSLSQRIPPWAIGAVSLVALLLVYVGLVHNINERAEPVMKELTQVGIPAQSETEGNDGTPVDTRYLEQVLQTEMDRDLVELEKTDNSASLVLGSEGLFQAGSAEVRDAVKPVLHKIARALESTEGTLQVTGHTDDRPIATDQFPSNWHLSLARATAVSDLLGAEANLDGRLWPEGRGEAEPRVDNDTAENRARNRRVEITLTP
ncbi:type VI secretion system protein ImpK [Halospina denitrificans]|uniref:Type VI secretion system protein ImpK n=1 Tax=Halospina denitrificans TaxID=332522 RepID=A0A4R7JZI7_9GAMM|nr:type VI secretion system protein TssL, long form [Halospina denitrificans]TDT43960.1 type VI secretion system protein ImpK [Halospina denitrificans]